MSSKVNRRRFLKYAGTGLAAAAVAGASFYLYGSERRYGPSITVPKEWASAKRYLTSTSTRTFAPESEWWKKAKTVTASVDFWNTEGYEYVKDAQIEVIDWLGCGAMDFTPAMIWREGVDELVDKAHSMGLIVRSYEDLTGTNRELGTYTMGADGHVYPPSPYGGESFGYPLKVLYQSDYWFQYFDEKWRNPDGSMMEDPIEGGCARNLGNQIVDFPDWGYSLMSIHNPYYLDYAKKCLQIDVDMGFDGVNLDNIAATPFAFWRGGDFSPWAEHKFREYLSETYSEKQLSEMGVGNVDEFSLRTCLLNRGYSNNVRIEDPIVKSWSIFEYKAFDSFLHAIQNHVKAYAQSKGKGWFAVSGNIYNLRGLPSPLTILATKSFDIIWLEETGQFMPPARISLLARQGRALSKSQKPVWQHISSDADVGKYLTSSYPNLLGILFAQIYSVGGIYLVDRLYYVAFTGPTWVHPMGPKSTELITSYCRFVRENERYFLDARPCRSHVGIAYSLPNMMMGFYPSLGLIRSSEWDRGIMGISHVLDREHIPFDFIILGHPEFWDDSETLSKLSDYEILALSNAEVVTEQQAEAIRNYVEKGGRLLSFGEIGTRDENYEKRRTSSLQDLTKPGLSRYGDGKTLHLFTNPGYTYWTNVVEGRKEDVLNYGIIRDAVESLTSRTPLVETNAPDVVAISLLQQTDHSFQAHVVNLDYDESDDSIKEKDGIKIKAKLPSGFEIEGKEGTLLSPDGDTDSGRLEFSSMDEYVELDIPRLKIYSIATIYDPAYLR